MYMIKSNVEKNRLYITLGKMDDTDIRGLIKEITHNTAALKPGFTCLVDIRNMDIKYSEKQMYTMELIMGGLIDAGMSRVVRVVSRKNKISQMRMEQGSRALGYRARPASTIEEGDRILDEEEARKVDDD
ncbi:MAG: hypothetical protein KKD44_24870 [Proteobacteria bacterium]|nr:hypothetical protein [Pseudomonadota bacterium]